MDEQQFTCGINDELVLETPRGSVRLVIVDLDGGKVRLGFAAARSIEVWRSELLGSNGIKPLLRAGGVP